MKTDPLVQQLKIKSQLYFRLMSLGIMMDYLLFRDGDSTGCMLLTWEGFSLAAIVSAVFFYHEFLESRLDSGEIVILYWILLITRSFYHVPSL